MISSEVQRTLVKSPPELWAELSDEAALARHLEIDGELRLTQVEPERLVAWETREARGKVELSPSGWGTKVKLSLEREPRRVEDADVEASVDAAGRVEDELVDETPPTDEQLTPAGEPEARRTGFFARLFRRRRAVSVEPEPREPVQEIDQTPPVDLAAELREAEERLLAESEALLNGVLDRLGAAHHRPFSRS